ncbi:tRNA (N(6)-L-threonylcarbamoyladenosine(37)-C(2))-methylthiotransferase [Theileria orientalis]|uniref:Threonylcarbamoyladenosine tRNA methylthiotransferase n=1 Tax=Theileria orientalis TaxID=68886 RepID=A0A976MDT1_THEOR|nr:tRNA (N(6)-L-threonylcarbamoyladenosine(37)-C(2))-methylthiotransferase [Theileria orientalis]
MHGNKLRGPIVACALLGVVCVSSIAYYFYNRSKKKSFLDRLKEAYNGDHGFFDNDDSVEHEDSYDLPEPSEYSDYLIVQATNQDNQVSGRSLDKGSKYDEFEEVAYIEDVADDGRSNRGYKILANTTLSKSRPSPPNDTQATRSTRSSDRSKKDASDEWTLLDNYTNVDGNAEELVYVESTNNTFSEEVDVQKDESVPLTCEEIEVSSENVDCCNSSNGTAECCSTDTFNNCNSVNGFIEGELCTDPVAEEVQEKIGGEDADESSDDDPSGGVLENANNPESTKIYFKNSGCSHNISDGEYMLGLLVDYGFKIVDTMEESHVVIINSCTVKGPSEDAMISFIRAASALNLPIIVSGCVPQADKNNPAFNSPRISLLGITQIDRIVEVVENSLQGNKMVLLEKKDLPQLDLPKIRRNKLIEIIPLSTGCLGSCTFCKTKHSRGVLGSYDVEVILDRVESCVNEGVKEIWLTSEDLGAYGIDIGTNLVTLLRSIIQVLPPDTMLRLGMSNPPYMKKYIDEICEILLHENVYEFIHIPVQSCSNSVLKKMNREYEVEEFLHLVETIREKVPNCTIATDIIAGFPTEKHEDHMITRTMLEELKLPVINISQFYPRKGTIASKMKQLGNKVRKNRSRDITSVFMSYETNSKYLNQVIKVYFNQINDQYQVIGHDKHYVKVLLALQVRHRTKSTNKKNKSNRSNGVNNCSNNEKSINGINNVNINNINWTNGSDSINGDHAHVNTIDATNNQGIVTENSHANVTTNGDVIIDTDGSINDVGISDNDSSDGYLSDGMPDATPITSLTGNIATTDSRYLTDKYFGTVQYVKIINTTKWHLEGIIV